MNVFEAYEKNVRADMEKELAEARPPADDPNKLFTLEKQEPETPPAEPTEPAEPSSTTLKLSDEDMNTLAAMVVEALKGGE